MLEPRAEETGCRPTGSAAIRAGRLVDVEAGAALADDLADVLPWAGLL